MKLNSVDEILDYAIQKEQEAADFYSDLAGQMEHTNMKHVFLSFSAEEQGHKSKLLAVKSGKKMLSSAQKVQDLKIGDYLVDVALTPGLDYQDVLIVAMKAEKAAFKLYNDLAETTDDANLRTVFLGLAQEEARHKLRFEIEYDDHMLNDN